MTHDEIDARVWDWLPGFADSLTPPERESAGRLIRARLVTVMQRGPIVALFPASLEEQINRIARIKDMMRAQDERRPG